ncbi:Uncharacterised protein [BD1-7 clade bacterium]|uniref:EamA domain-containing protein n=1 Tax=BD1-7 clade bacterium TaxID=2029982 RepID=A0A5S9NSK0_9GAMM|nr:Uncharacterised protein [BD1-7 clade bacterium]CAA0108914.1 Uncharacterised protein [BD1-7 clade bacterium]
MPTLSRFFPLLVAAITMMGFAANSILCRLAFANNDIDPGSFTLIRLLSGVFSLTIIGTLLRPSKDLENAYGSSKNTWAGGFFLFTYAAAFSFAYTQLEAGTGALLLFGAGQFSLLLANVVLGYRLNRAEIAGFALGFGGLCVLFLPGASSPPLTGAALMVVAGGSWAMYTLTGRSAPSPIHQTWINFVKSTPWVALMAIVILVIDRPSIHISVDGAIYAMASGAIASGMIYSLWYLTLKHLSLLEATVSQLSVPSITAVGGLFLINEPITPTLILATILTLAGISIVITSQRRRN